VSFSGLQSASAGCWDRVRALPASRAIGIALAIWVVYAVTVAAIVAIGPDQRTVTTEYRQASEHWWGGEKSLYRKKNGYLYLPQFAQLYTPYDRLPARVGEPLWRLTGLALLAFGLWRASALLSPSSAGPLFLTATLLVLPASFSSARNGQVNLPLAGLFLLIAASLARERWGRAAVLLAFTLILKPIALAPILLCSALYPKLRPPMVLALLAVAALPFLHPHPAYAWREYGNFAWNLGQAGSPTGHSWCDFAGMLRTFGMDLPATAQLGIRALAGLLALWAAARALRTLEPTRGAFAVLFLSTIYLMLFNPRTETNSYIMLAAFVALLAGLEGLIARKNVAAGCLVLLAVILGSENYGWPIFPLTNLWLKALSTCALTVWLFLLLPGQTPHRPHSDTP